jgi:hypothetical protein
MGMSDRRKAQQAKKKSLKEARMKGPKKRGQSAYALKKQGVYPKNSPYLGDWGPVMRKLRAS